MKCRACQAENKPGARFCAQCGAILAVPAAAQLDSKSCPACRYGCKPDAKFCPKCGHGFAASLTAPLPPEPDQTPALTAAPTATDNAADNVAAAATTETCPQCTAPLKINARFCGKCGCATGVGRFDGSGASAVNAAFLAATVATVSAPLPEQAPAATAVMPARPESVNLPPLPVRRRSLAPVIVAASALLAALGGAAAYYLMHGDVKSASSQTVLPATAPLQPAAGSAIITETAEPSATAAVSAPTNPVETRTAAAVPTAIAAPSAQQPFEPAAAAPVAAPIAAKPPPKPAKPKPVPAGSAARDAGADALDPIIKATLSQASHCLEQKKYDCTIANADTALRMAPGNQRAVMLKREAKQAQERALADIQIE